MKVILPQAPFYTLPPAQEYQSWTSISVQSLALSALVNLPGQGAAAIQMVNSLANGTEDVWDELSSCFSNVGMAGPYRRLEVFPLLCDPQHHTTSGIYIALFHSMM